MTHNKIMYKKINNNRAKLSSGGHTTTAQLTGYRMTKNKGFTLVETMVAVSILSLSIAATFTAVQNGIQNSTLAKDQTTAFYLAQEAMEFIKNTRDENALNNVYAQSNNLTAVNWLHGMSEVAGDPCYFGKVCEVDAPLKTITNCGSAAITTNPPLICPVLNQDTASTGLFGYTGSWPASRFRREIQFRQLVADTEVEVIVSVSWTARGATKSFQASETFFSRQ